MKVKRAERQNRCVRGDASGGHEPYKTEVNALAPRPGRLHSGHPPRGVRGHLEFDSGKRKHLEVDAVIGSA